MIYQQQIQPSQELYQPLEVQAQWLQTLVMILLAIGMIAYFIKAGPAKFFEKMWEE